MFADGATELVLALCCWHTVSFFGEGVMNADQAPLFIISAVIEAGGSLVGGHTTWRESSLLGRHNDISFLHAIMHCWLLLQVKVLCRYLLLVLCWISLPIKCVVKVSLVWHPGLLSVFCPLLCCQNSSKYDHFCVKGIADFRCYSNIYFLCENCVALPELNLWK